MQTLQRPLGGRVRNRLSRKPRRPAWPRLAAAALIIVPIVAFLGKAGALVVMGLSGLVVSVASAPGVRMTVREVSPGRRWLFPLWFTAALLFSLAFIESGIAHLVAGRACADLTDIELRRTALAACLLGLWWMGVRPAGRACAVYCVLFTLVALDVGRILAFGLRPGPVSYFLWALTVISACKYRVWELSSAR